MPGEAPGGRASSRSAWSCRSGTSPPAPATSSPTGWSATTASPATPTPISISMPGADFDRKVIVKVNAGELVRARTGRPALARRARRDGHQRGLLPARRGALPADAADHRGAARLRQPVLDPDQGHADPAGPRLLRQAAEVTRVGLSFSVGFVDEELWRAVEPGTPSPRRRLDAVRQLTDAGFAVGVLMAPILPGLSDDDESVETTVAAIAAAGATNVTPLALHLRPGAREWYAALAGPRIPAAGPPLPSALPGGRVRAAGIPTGADRAGRGSPPAGTGCTGPRPPTTGGLPARRPSGHRATVAP